MNESVKSIVVLSVISASAAAGFSQSESSDDSPNVYLDCWPCDHDYVQTEITYVDYVRNRQDADIHILVTRQRTGGGGTEYTLTYFGQNSFSGTNDTLVFASNQTDTQDIIREEMVRVLELGLVPYLSKTSLAKNLSVSYLEPRKEAPSKVHDRWKNWVFSTSFRSYLSGEQTRNLISLGGSLGARKITEDWKIRMSAGGNYNESNFEFGGQTITSITRSQSFNASVIRSLTNHWSIGMWASAYSSTYTNIDYSLMFLPGIEYNYYPYSESTRRQLRFQYRMGGEYTDYTEETIYLKLNEALSGGETSVTFDVTQPWGSVSTTLSGSQYFGKPHNNRLELFGNLRLKLFKGLSLNLYANVSRIRDQLFLAKGDRTLEEVLLEQKQLATKYDYSTSISLSYSFGSIYSAVVNPRFGGVGGRRIFY